MKSTQRTFGAGLHERARRSRLLSKVGSCWLSLGLMVAAFACSRAAEDRSMAGQHGQEVSMRQLIEEISNNQVFWDGNTIGLEPTLTGRAAQRLVEKRGEAIPALLATLSDPDRFVVAHVLLTRLSGVEHDVFPTWNGLAVELRADGTVVIDPAQRFTLARRWSQWARASPSPKTLPAGED